MSAATYSTDQVRRDAIAAGHSPKVADYLVRQIGLDQTRVKAGELRSKPAGTPSPLSRSARTAAPRATVITKPQTRTIAAVAAMYGPGAVALVPRFAAAGLSTKRVTEMLAAETGDARHLGEIGARRLSYQLDQIGAT